MILDVLLAILIGVGVIICVYIALVLFMVFCDAFEDGKWWAAALVFAILGGALAYCAFSLGWSVVR